jgi:hypothetical protein
MLKAIPLVFLPLVAAAGVVISFSLSNVAGILVTVAALIVIAIGFLKLRGSWAPGLVADRRTGMLAVVLVVGSSLLARWL